MKIGIIGLGRVGELLVSCLKVKEPVNVYSTRYNHEVGGIKLHESGKAVVEASDVVFLSVPSKNLKDVLAEIKPFVRGKTIVNTSVGYTPSYVQKQLVKDVEVVHLIPSMIGLGHDKALFGYACRWQNSRKVKMKLRNVFQERIELLEINSRDLCRMTALIACYPAFIYSFMDIIMSRGMDSGKFTKTEFDVIITSTKFALDRFEEEVGSGEFLKKIETKGGATEAGIHMLKRHKIDRGLLGALDAAEKNCKKRMKTYMSD